MQPALTGAQLLAAEDAAADLAREAGGEILAAFGRQLEVTWKRDGSGGWLGDPVTVVDRRVEARIRAALAERFPGEPVLGEETDADPDVGDGPLWVVDPLDGTANFASGLPLFGVSIAWLVAGYPAAGAVWCATGPALRPGVYHAHAGSPLRYDGRKWQPLPAPDRRGLAAEPGGQAEYTAWCDARHMGTAAVESALVAAGVFRIARFRAPRIWDVAAGAVLVRATGGEIWTRAAGPWRPLDRFVPPAPGTGLRRWAGAVVMGTPAAVRRAVGA